MLIACASYSLKNVSELKPILISLSMMLSIHFCSCAVHCLIIFVNAIVRSLRLDAFARHVKCSFTSLIVIVDVVVTRVDMM